jgi:hypothetical protein
LFGRELVRCTVFMVIVYIWLHTDSSWVSLLALSFTVIYSFHHWGGGYLYEPGAYIRNQLYMAYTSTKIKFCNMNYISKYIICTIDVIHLFQYACISANYWFYCFLCIPDTLVFLS